MHSADGHWLTPFQAILLRRALRERRVVLVSPEGRTAARGLARLGYVVMTEDAMTPTRTGLRALVHMITHGQQIARFEFEG